MGAGRPTDYRPEYCEQVVALMSEGASKHEVARELECSFRTLLNWQESHPEFLQAVKEGEDASRGWWERLGRLGASGAHDINPTTFIFNMKNRFRDDWSDMTKRELSGPGGEPLAFPPVTVTFVEPK